MNGTCATSPACTNIHTNIWESTYTKFTISPGAKSLLVAFDIFEHLNNAELICLLKQIKRVSKKNGFLVARFPNADSPFGMPYQNGDISHLSSIGSEKCRYYSNILRSELIFIGGEKQILFSNSIGGTLRNLLSIIIIKITDSLVNLLFLRGIKISFSSSNLIWILRF